MSSIINFAILGNPVNWMIVVMVVIFAAYAAFVISKNTGAVLPQL